MSDPAAQPAVPAAGADPGLASQPSASPAAPAVGGVGSPADTGPTSASSPLPSAPPPIINTQNARLDDALSKCPRCGSTDIALDPATGMLVCAFCRYTWSEANVDEKYHLSEGLDMLTGVTMGSGAKDITPDASSIVTLKCPACGAEVVIDTAHAMTARCHWCRHNLSLNDQIPNGAVPDAVLPFKLPKADAVARIKAFVGKRRAFALGRFKREFSPENVVGVYLPYMIVDARASSDLAGAGEIKTRSYSRTVNNQTTTYYDADVYRVTRHVDFTVDDLQIEASAERANMNVKVNTNNVINAILPFDTKSAVEWNGDYLIGFTSEKRDVDVAGLTPVLDDQLMSIARAQALPSIGSYDRGVRWEQERIDVAGSRWLSMYLPVWLYSYYQEEKQLLHYIAVNARTGETMGSVPVQQWKLLMVALATGTILEGVALGIVGWWLW